ncbi:DUF4335 domain-containing protein [Aerosakkonema sp. BLCC-F183]|uniref:DUF4335 domain-containing protein n=1 Tax=Aerosakkonema sp. BLCC-F183 TaxID=3342834 RepID=UPI0035BAA1DC
MTIQRQYSLPNCTLLLEGLSDTTSSGQIDVRPVMSILVNAECRIAGSPLPLTGGREFFESLLGAVSRYAQEFLSGVPHLHNLDNVQPLVQLRRINRNLHRLIVQRRGDVHVTSNGLTGNTASTAPIEIDLTTVQLFDLVEAVDQFFADSQTLPGLSLQVTPVERRYANADRPIVKRAAPAAIGVSSLAVAAIALFFVPVPEVQKPKDPLPRPAANSLDTTTGVSGQVATGSPPRSPSPVGSETVSSSSIASETTSPSSITSETASSITTETASPSPVVSETPSPIASETASPSPIVSESPSPIASETASPSPVVSETSPSPIASETSPSPVASETASSSPVALETASPSPVASETASPSPVASETPSTSPSEISATATTESVGNSELRSEITDPIALRDLNRRLHRQILENKQEKLRFPRQLIYRVAVRPDGTIADYEGRNQSAIDYVNETPLPKLKTSPTATVSGTGSQEPVAYYKVVFTPRGVPQVSPWRGYR